MTEHDKADELSPDEMRAAPGTGRDNLESNEMTSWDGAGSPIKHVITDDESGHLSEGTGGSTEDAKKDANDSSHMLSEDASPGTKGPGSG